MSRRPILSVFITRENKLNSRSALIQFCLSLVMIIDRLGLHSVLLPLLIKFYFIVSSFLQKKVGKVFC